MLAQVMMQLLLLLQFMDMLLLGAVVDLLLLWQLEGVGVGVVEDVDGCLRGR